MTELVLESPFNSALLLMDFQEFVLNNFVPAPRAAEVVARTSDFFQGTANRYACSSCNGGLPVRWSANGQAQQAIPRAT